MNNFAIVLSADQWNQILTILAEQPFRVSAPLIQQIQAQAHQAQLQQAAPPAHANGHDHMEGAP